MCTATRDSLRSCRDHCCHAWPLLLERTFAGIPLKSRCSPPTLSLRACPIDCFSGETERGARRLGAALALNLEAWLGTAPRRRLRVPQPVAAPNGSIGHALKAARDATPCLPGRRR